MAISVHERGFVCKTGLAFLQEHFSGALLAPVVRCHIREVFLQEHCGKRLGQPSLGNARRYPLHP